MWNLAGSLANWYATRSRRMDLTKTVAIPWVLPIICGSIVAIVAIIGGVVSDCVKATSRTRLKRTIVEHGYTA